jgi:hypothetical protein
LAKRKQQDEDIVSETQRNSRWLLGFRDNQRFADMTPEEWEQFRRRQRGRRMRMISALILLAVAAVFIFNAASDLASGSWAGVVGIAACAIYITALVVSLYRNEHS